MNARQERLLNDSRALSDLDKNSTILTLEPSGDPPDRYSITFRGKGIRRNQDRVEIVEEHECELQLPYSYPDSPPTIRWLTPIFHPNVSFSGFIELDEIGLPWDKDIGLDAVCERLWDVVRMSFVNLEDATNYTARSWLEDGNCTTTFPVDTRPLRDKTNPASRSNVVQYRRKDPNAPPQPESGVFYIGEDTSAPKTARPDDDIFFIGD